MCVYIWKLGDRYVLRRLVINDRAFLTTCARGQFRKLAVLENRQTAILARVKKGMSSTTGGELRSIHLLYIAARLIIYRVAAVLENKNLVRPRRHASVTPWNCSPDKSPTRTTNSTEFCFLSLSLSKRVSSKQWSIWHGYSTFEIFD